MQIAVAVLDRARPRSPEAPVVVQAGAWQAFTWRTVDVGLDADYRVVVV